MILLYNLFNRSKMCLLNRLPSSIVEQLGWHTDTKPQENMKRRMDL